MKSKFTLNSISPFLFVLLIIFSVGCKKDKVSNTERLTNKSWKVVALTVSPGIDVNGTVITDFYSQLADCNKDDIYTFSTNKTYTIDEDGLKCNQIDPQTTTGVWSFNSDETVLTLDNTTSYSIIQLDDNTLKASYSEVTNGINYTYTITFNKQ
ncbi:MAG: DUF5004 domain-containing protein [Chitinophagales bacterium]|nr:DUF5004 domain-containing protein [Chitinophagales bacterium]